MSKPLRVLIGCERFGRVRDAFLAIGCDAYSCDLLPTAVPGPHIQEDVLVAMQFGWDLGIFFPDCTHLAVSGALRFKDKLHEQAEAVEFFMKLTRAPIEKTAIENPVGIMSTRWRKPDQIIQPYQFGEDASKKTCLWLKGLEPLTIDPDQYVAPRMVNGKPRWANQTDSGQNRLGPSEGRAAIRGMTYPGIAKAMTQWIGT
jgi:hypothetical protein